MKNTLRIDCPAELLLGLQMSAETFAQEVKMRTAISLFREGRISSGLAARWLGIPRISFLFRAMESGAEFLENSEDDFRREMSLL